MYNEVEVINDVLFLLKNNNYKNKLDGIWETMEDKNAGGGAFYVVLK